ncbi:MAG: hypothetical protein EHM33_31110, partial [Chloroflexi bacterium]
MRLMVAVARFLPLCALMLVFPAIAAAQSTQERIQQLERFLKENPGVFDWKVHNELRHLYITNNPRNPRRSMEYSNVILQHSFMDIYILNILSEWQIGKNTSTARANLLRSAPSFPDLRFIAAACFLKIGDLYAAEGNKNEAKSPYLKVAEDKSSDMTRYRVLAEERLRGLKEQPAPTPPVPRPVPTPPPSISNKVKSIEEVDFANFTFPPVEDCAQRSVSLRMGRFEDKEIRVQLRRKILYADLTSEKINQAIVTLDCDTYGNFFITEIFFYALRNGEPVLLAKLAESIDRDYKKYYPDGFTWGISKVVANNGKLIIHKLADGSHACPENDVR